MRIMFGGSMVWVPDEAVDLSENRRKSKKGRAEPNKEEARAFLEKIKKDFPFLKYDSLNRALDSYYGKFATSKNALTRSSTVAEVWK